jgi:hypothetical protein
MGNAIGDPKIQMMDANVSTPGVTASKPSAQVPKQPFSPHPDVHQLGQTASTAFCAMVIICFVLFSSVVH